jgi:hypothetical protein
MERNILELNPSLKMCQSHIIENGQRLAHESFCGLNVSRVRQECHLSTSEWNVSSGHQPTLFHPGIYAKCIAAGAIAESVSGKAVHYIIDTDLPKEHRTYIPTNASSDQVLKMPLELEHEMFWGETPYTFLPKFNLNTLSDFFEKAQNDSGILSQVKKGVQFFKDDILKNIERSSSWIGFHQKTLELLDQIVHQTRQFKLGTEMWQQTAFYMFLEYWVLHLEEWFEAYNQALDQYRQREQITHAASPVPNLRKMDGWMEIPFWGVMHNQQRCHLFIQRAGEKFMMQVFETQEMFQIQKKSSVLEWPIPVWPKAMTQTLFFRLYLTDYFIHGTGGKQYEEVNDIFFQLVFKKPRLHFGVATSTQEIAPGQLVKVQARMEQTRKMSAWYRRLTQNPEDLIFLAEKWGQEVPPVMGAQLSEVSTHPRVVEYAFKKKQEVDKMKNPEWRKQAGEKIREYNQILLDELKNSLAILHHECQDLELLMLEQDAFSFREYPFFCYPPEVFVTMKQYLKERA